MSVVAHLPAVARDHRGPRRPLWLVPVPVYPFPFTTTTGRLPLHPCPLTDDGVVFVPLPPPLALSAGPILWPSPTTSGAHCWPPCSVAPGALRGSDVNYCCLATSYTMALSPEQAFSLLCRTVADITAKNATNGHNLPLLLLFRVFMSQRNLVFTHTQSDTRALATYMTTSFQTPKLDEAVKTLAAAFRVPVVNLDISARVKVRWLLVICGVCRFVLWGESDVHGVPSLTTSPACSNFPTWSCCSRFRVIGVHSFSPVCSVSLVSRRSTY